MIMQSLKDLGLPGGKVRVRSFMLCRLGWCVQALCRLMPTYVYIMLTDGFVHGFGIQNFKTVWKKHMFFN